MSFYRGLVMAFLALFAAAAPVDGRGSAPEPGDSSMTRTISLPEPRQQSDCAVEQALAARRSTREFSGQPMSLAEAGQLLWAAQGITHGDGFRTAPSAGALYPLELHLITGRVGGLELGVYHYAPEGHSLQLRRSGDLLGKTADAALGQRWMADAAAILVISAVERRTSVKYGPYADRYVAIEAGHAAQSVALQGVALGLGTGFVGAFDAGEVADLLGLGPEQEVYYLLPVGRPREPVRCGE